MKIVGVDEVGRGCWAGPLVAAAVLLPDELSKELKGLADSKVLTKASRQRLFNEIIINAQSYGLGWVWPYEIDSCGLTEAVRIAMARALSAVDDDYDQLIIDGNYNFFPENPKAEAVIKADGSVPAASAASILAKVARDQYMEQLSLHYPEYGFATHVGYGTKLHIEALKAHGVTPLHRLSYKPIANLVLQSGA